DAADLGAVLADPLAEALDPLGGTERALRAVRALDESRGRGAADRRAHAAEDLLARAHRHRHQSRKLSRATGSRSRLRVQPASGPGARRIRPPRTNGRCASRASRRPNEKRRGPPKAHATARIAARSE